MDLCIFSSQCALPLCNRMSDWNDFYSWKLTLHAVKIYFDELKWIRWACNYHQSYTTLVTADCNHNNFFDCYLAFTIIFKIWQFLGQACIAYHSSRQCIYFKNHCILLLRHILELIRNYLFIFIYPGAFVIGLLNLLRSCYYGNMKVSTLEMD